MELEHRFTVAAPVEQAWEVLLDLERIAPCLPGATLTSYEGDEFAGNVRVKLGPVVMTFTGAGRFVERDVAARRMVIEASGKDRRGGGTARATVRSTLHDEGDGSTAVEVHTDLVITGRAAQFGRGMIADVSGRLLDQFTDCLAGKLAATPEPAPVAAAAPEAAAPGPAAVPAPAAPAAPAAGAAVEPIDLLGVTGVRAAAVRLVPYLITFLVGAVVGGGVVALLVS
jgi:carbon monoxide dehydrogenase subunit G